MSINVQINKIGKEDLLLLNKGDTTTQVTQVRGGSNTLLTKISLDEFQYNKDLTIAEAIEDTTKLIVVEILGSSNTIKFHTNKDLSDYELTTIRDVIGNTNKWTGSVAITKSITISGLGLVKDKLYNLVFTRKDSSELTCLFSLSTALTTKLVLEI